MTTETAAIHDALPPGPRSALHACALALGASRGPTLLRSAVPQWEATLRSRIGDQLFAPADAGRPAAQAWVGAVWLEPQRQTWRAELGEIAAELPGGGLLSIIVSLPLAFLHGGGSPASLGMLPSGAWQLRRGLTRSGFRVERTFAFHTPRSSMLHWLATRLRSRRPDWSDRVHSAMRRRFAASDFILPLATAGLIQARAGMRP